MENEKVKDTEENKETKEEIKEGNEKVSPESTEKEDPDKELEEAKKKASELENKCKETNDKYLRIMAEYDNFRKRTAKERDGIYKEAYSDAIKQILPLIDNMERASAYKDGDELAKGVGMIVSSISDTLKKMGVCEIETKKFDPKLHNAVMHVEDENLGEGEIVEVFQKGYMLGDKVIRHAMVKVAN